MEFQVEKRGFAIRWTTALVNLASCIWPVGVKGRWFGTKPEWILLYSLGQEWRNGKAASSNSFRQVCPKRFKQRVVCWLDAMCPFYFLVLELSYWTGLTDWLTEWRMEWASLAMFLYRAGLNHPCPGRSTWRESVLQRAIFYTNSLTKPTSLSRVTYAIWESWTGSFILKSIYQAGGTGTSEGEVGSIPILRLYLVRLAASSFGKEVDKANWKT